MITYYYDDVKLTAKTDTGARRQANKVIKDRKKEDVKYDAPNTIEFFRSSDHCNGWFHL